MAALTRRYPNLDDFVGLNWSCWVDGLRILPSNGESPPGPSPVVAGPHYYHRVYGVFCLSSSQSDIRATQTKTHWVLAQAVSDTEDNSKYGRSSCETMTLHKEDMHIYGHCPAHDEIYLVVCSLCGQLVKPQAFEKHCDQQHGAVTQKWGQSPASASEQLPQPSHTASSISSLRESQTDSRCQKTSAPSSSALPDHQHITTKDQRNTPSFSLAETFPQKTPLPLRSSSTPYPWVPLRLSGPLPTGHCSSKTSLAEKSTVQKPTTALSCTSQSSLRERKTYSQVHKNSDEKEFDLNKQFGVLDPERKKPSSQELICNMDPFHQQQKGRTNTFEQLGVEPKTASAEQNMEQLLVKTKENVQCLEALEDKITTRGNKYDSNSSSHTLRARGSSECFMGEEGDSAVAVGVQPPYPFNQTLLYSDEDEDDKQEETIDLPTTQQHPKPLGICTFGCRAFGCSIFTFDRRWHHLRFALSAMLEHHLGTHLWKKMPQVSSGLRSFHAPSSVRTGSRPPKSTGTLSLDSTSLSQTDTKISQHYLHSTKLLPSTRASLSTGGGGSIAAGRCSKTQRREVALMHGAKSENKSSKPIRDTPLHEKSQPHILSSNRPVNGSFSDVKKQCPPLQQSPHSRRRPPGTQQKVIDFEQSSPGQKRKGSKESLSSSQSKSFKYQRLSSTWSMEKRGNP